MANTVLIDEPTDVPDEYLEFARSFIAACRFRAPKNLPNSPHEYQPRDQLDPVLQPVYDRFDALIASHGYRGHFLYVTYAYLNVDGWRYWISNAYFPPAQRGMINRANNAMAPLLRPDDPRVNDPATHEF